MKYYLFGSLVLALACTACQTEPSADFQVSATTVEVGEVVLFLDASHNAYHHVYDFGDGTPSSTTPDPTHVFGRPGTYEVVLTVQSRNFKAASRTSTIIEVVEVPPADLDPIQIAYEKIEGEWKMDSMLVMTFVNDVLDSNNCDIVVFDPVSTINFISEDKVILNHFYMQNDASDWQLLDGTNMLLNAQIYSNGLRHYTFRELSDAKFVIVNSVSSTYQDNTYQTDFVIIMSRE